MPGVPRHRWVAAIAALACVLGVAPQVAAAPPRLTLTWTAPAGCPSAAAVEAEVDRLLGSRSAPVARPIVVSVVVSERRPGEWQLRLRSADAGPVRERTLRGTSCAVLAGAAAVVLALMIDPTAPIAEPRDLSLPPPPPASRPAPRLPASRPSARAVADQPAPRKKPRPWLSVRASAWVGADVGSLPTGAFGVGIVGTLLLYGQRLDLGFEWWPRRSVDAGGQPGAGAEVDLIAGSVVTCRPFLRGRVQLGPCLGLEAGRLRAVGFGVTAPGEGTSAWVAPRGGLITTFSVTRRVVLALRLDAVVPLLRPRFVLINVGEVHQPWPVAGRATLGAEYVFR